MSSLIWSALRPVTRITTFDSSLTSSKPSIKQRASTPPPINVQAIIPLVVEQGIAIRKQYPNLTIVKTSGQRMLHKSFNGR